MSHNRVLISHTPVPFVGIQYVLEDLGCFCFSKWVDCVPFFGVVLSGKRLVVDTGFAPIVVMVDFEDLEGLFVVGGVEVEGVSCLWWGGGEVLCCVCCAVCVVERGGVWGVRWRGRWWGRWGCVWNCLPLD